MKILWHSVAPWVGSGYGQQTALFTPRIKASGHDLAISAYYGLMGAKMRWGSVDCYPAYAKSYGSDVICLHAIDHFGNGERGRTFGQIANDGLIITLGDVWTLNQPLLADMNVAAWVPIDHETIPPIVSVWFEQTGAVPIAMSRFGEQLLIEAGFNPLYVPHGFDGDVFFPADQAEARQRVGLPPDAFVVAMVAANVGKDGSRKAFYEQILAFGELRRRHPDAVLALHTDVTSPYGVDIRSLLSDFPPESYLVTDQYAYKVGIPQTVVADIYRAADVLTNVSYGEGFGCPIIEAQACGTPVIVADTTAMPELVGAGWKVPGEPLWHDSQSAWARKPSIGAIVDAYEAAYEKARDVEMRAQAWQYVQNYEVTNVMEHFWVPALERLESALVATRNAPKMATAGAAQPWRIATADGLYWLDRGVGYGDSLGWADHEKELVPIVTDLVGEDSVVLDVGAHVGHWSLRLARQVQRVYAVEANPDTAAVLRKNIALNDLDNVEVAQIAAWDCDQMMTLFDPNHQIGGGSTRVVENIDEQSDSVVVQASRLDRLFGAIERLDLVKLDVEGADLHALRGMQWLLSEYRPTLFIECHDYCGYYERGELETLLTGLGYEWKIAYSYQTHWSPEGVTDEPRQADYLICTPKD